MESKSNFSNLVEHATLYAEKRGEILLLDVAEKVSGVSGSVVSGIVMGVLSVFVLLFASIGGAWWIGQALENVAMGFFIITGFYLLLFIIVLVAGKKLIQNAVIDLIIKKILYAE